MRKFFIEEKLDRYLHKISHKDKVLYDTVFKKMEEILSCSDVHHYKNLRKPLQDYTKGHKYPY